MSTSTPSFRVSLITWDAFDTTIEAATEEAALEQAQALYDRLGRGGFFHRAGGVDGWVCDAD